ncbi:mu1 adaptin [Cardiosporidium cionae]|uniref:Mu1 adaptin n=1 Tax=Cardiosporidium cionae TaxID=476202 RepID=A0ABQ7JAB4_9APIC|nr:mu1 adaptin [Cardiosporidium cionae]|eukprot:KAF8820909.1 mu1 adaptin [Cardiosporidium cionae]
MIDAVLLVSMGGEVLIGRTYKGDTARVDGLLFAQSVVLTKELSDKPIRSIGSSHFVHIVVGSVIFVASTRENANFTLIVKVLYKFSELLSSYFGGKLTDNIVRKNFVLVYELLDEIVDGGYPQILELDVLKRYITQGERMKEDLNDEAILKKITVQATGSCSWRAEGIKYRKNEIYIDVVEQVNMLVSQGGQLLRADVTGQIMVKSMLSGMPECKFGMNDKLIINKTKPIAEGTRQGETRANTTRSIALDDCRFHQCVRLSAFDLERTITFIPPDGHFELMTYRTTENINLPFKIFPVLQEKGRTKLDVSLLLKSTFSRVLVACNIVIQIPLPEHSAKVNVTTQTLGKARYETSKHMLIWRIKRFPGESECSLIAEADLVPSMQKRKWSRPPISMSFKVPMFMSSGLTVRFLRVQEKANYKPIKWIRYVTKAGSYQHRI